MVLAILSACLSFLAHRGGANRDMLLMCGRLLSTTYSSNTHHSQLWQHYSNAAKNEVRVSKVLELVSVTY
jgi:hypothetical protein